MAILLPEYALCFKKKDSCDEKIITVAISIIEYGLWFARDEKDVAVTKTIICGRVEQAA